MRFDHYDPGDYQAVCDFLIALNRQDKIHINWNWARWEWMYAHPNCDRTLLSTIGLWKEHGRIVGAAIYDLYHGEAFCAVLDGYEELLPEILEYAYRNLKDDHGLGIAVHDGDAKMQALLLSLGYHKAEQKETILCRSLEQDIIYGLPDGFTIRKINFPEDEFVYQRVIWKGFDHEGEDAELEKMLANKVQPPNRRPELCLAVTDETGEFAGHCTCWYDGRTDYAYVEPVCTIPKYRGMGLGKAVVFEALNRCKGMGAAEAYVISKQAFYHKLGFEKHSEYGFFVRENQR
ncbi:MAG: GNAT family N-acetyltransferase [Oscillospiraceae bacterium]|nr:GNAT family N-acetyltransferase [Oscillospiraceae bacterium]MBQ7001104.1 GNAT family N-acetyltransferase [Oscillospiraceae bacterium]